MNVTIAVIGLLAVLLPTAVSAQETPTCDGVPATIVGTEGPDNLVGTTGRDVIVGLGGNDVIRGLSGADILCGGPGRDRILGGKQSDVIIGGDDGDKLFGDAGIDYIYGERGNDLLIGGQGDDVLDGGRGRKDRIRGRSGQDTCVDEQTSTRFDTSCLSGPAGGRSFRIDQCFSSGNANEVVTTGRVTSTDAFRVDYRITVDLMAGDSVVGTEVAIAEDVRIGETVRWSVSTPNGVTGVTECVAEWETFEPLNLTAADWNITLDTCVEGDDDLTATGSGVSPSNATEDIFVVVHMIGNDGIRYERSPLDFLEGVAPGAAFDFDAVSFPDFPDVLNGVQFCDAFVLVATE